MRLRREALFEHFRRASACGARLSSGWRDRRSAACGWQRRTGGTWAIVGTCFVHQTDGYLQEAVQDAGDKRSFAAIAAADEASARDQATEPGGRMR